MTGEELRALQAPLKDQYKQDEDSAIVWLSAVADLNVATVSCQVVDPVTSSPGLHTATGGDGSWGCSADMLLQSVVACAGVTLCAVVTAMGLPVTAGRVIARGEWDCRGTLGLSRESPVGLKSLELLFQLESTATEEQHSKLLQLTERYCVVLQTIAAPPGIQSSVERL